MKYLKHYKNMYRKAKTSQGKASAMTNAMTNLYPDDREKFIKWQIEYMNKETNQN